MKRLFILLTACLLTFCVSCDAEGQEFPVDQDPVAEAGPEYTGGNSGASESPEEPPVDPPVEEPAEDPDVKSIKILAVGNSFSVDAMEYLYGILKDVGYEEIVLGNLYIGGCTLETHYGHFAKDNAKYEYYKNETGTWGSLFPYKPCDALEDEEWDYITMQQASPKSGLSDTYDPYLSDLVDIVREHCPESELAWHMTWAYQANSSHSGFASYEKDQMTMYKAIVSAVETNILSREDFVKVIPNGTAVQNMRTSYVGDNLTRDGYHMSYDVGRYLTALTFAKTLTGCDLSEVTYTSSAYTYSDKLLAAMKEAADNACDKPYEVTQSEYPFNPDADFAELLENEGYDIAAYEQLELGLTKFAYYNSTEDTSDPDKLYSASTASGTTYKKFVATKIFAKENLPVGSLIVVRNGYQYRPDAWTALDVKTSSRPGNVSTYVTVVTDEWWGDWNYRGFNLAKQGTPELTATTVEDVCGSFAIFVPKK